jgi:arylsulfatase A-like enzyme
LFGVHPSGCHSGSSFSGSHKASEEGILGLLPSGKRVIVRFLCLAFFLSSTYSSSGAPVSAPPKPNVLIIIADQWRAQAFGFAGDPNVKTPNLDRLQRQSAWFVNAIAGVPVCCPTRASLLTGQRALTHGVFLNDVPLATNAVTLAKVLANAGYDTGYIGKWHLNGDGRSSFIPRERRQGFDYWKVLECTHDYTNSAYYADAAQKMKWEGYDAIAQTRDAQTYLRDPAHTNKPFLLCLAWGPPHDPYQTAPRNFHDLYRAEKLKLRPNVPAEAQARARKDLAGYYAHCSALDQCVGDVLRTLAETDLERNTIVIFTSDHGDMLGSQNLWHKQKPYDESIRVPLLIRWPDGLGTRSRKLNALINSEDMLPTVLGLCGLPIPKSVEGLDFSGYLRGGKNPSNAAALIACIAPFGEWSRQNGGREFRGVRTMRYTYVCDLDGPWLLFDNDRDPFQTENLSGAPRYAKTEAELDRLLHRKLEAAHDHFLPGNDYIRKWNYQVNESGTVAYAR